MLIIFWILASNKKERILLSYYPDLQSSIALNILYQCGMPFALGEVQDKYSDKEEMSAKDLNYLLGIIFLLVSLDYG